MYPLQRYLTRMAIFLAAIVMIVSVLFSPLKNAFFANAPLNGLILGVLLLGILYAFRQVLTLKGEADWIESYRRDRNPVSGATPKLLAPIATMLGERRDGARLSTASMRAVLDSISSRLDESRDISRYLIGLLIFLGLLGTFWGLLLTINSVNDVISNLSVGSGTMGDIFTNLKIGLKAPLGGMGTAFSSSLFGLAGSLVLGFLDLQASQAQNRFYNNFEEWLSGVTRLSGAAPIGDGEQSVPAYVEALLEQTAESLDDLRRIVSRGEESRIAANTSTNALTERLSALTDQMRTEQNLMEKLAQSQLDLQPVLARLAEATPKQEQVLDETTRGHIRNIEVYLARLLEEMSSGRTQTVEELRSEIKLLARTIAATDEKRS
ncbi:MAG: flagellar motor protein MotA [Alphaproteobacteria bacterium]